MRHRSFGKRGSVIAPTTEETLQEYGKRVGLKFAQAVSKLTFLNSYSMDFKEYFITQKVISTKQ